MELTDVTLLPTVSMHAPATHLIEVSESLSAALACVLNACQVSILQVGAVICVDQLLQQLDAQLKGCQANFAACKHQILVRTEPQAQMGKWSEEV